MVLLFVVVRQTDVAVVQQKSQRVCFRVVDTHLGPMAFVVGPRGLRGVELPRASAKAVRESLLRSHADAVEDEHLWPQLATMFERYAAGEPTDFDVPLDVADAPVFERRIWAACRKVQWGQTASYKDLAVRVGEPKAARAVGRAMGRNRCPIVVPCHRILRSDGSLGGYSGHTGLSFKQRLLEMEGSWAVEAALFD